MKRALFLLPALLLSFASVVWSQTTGSINGVVTAGGKAVAAGALSFASGSDSSYSSKVSTDAAGNYAVTSVPVGDVDIKIYDVRGKFLGNATARILPQGGSVTLRINLP